MDTEYEEDRRAMIKIIISIAGFLANKFKNLESWLKSKNDVPTTQGKFVDLAPTDDADSNNIYSEALAFATDNNNVFNIALTGPYGSGKSSVIKSFLKKYKRSALHISLAAFLSEDDSAIEKVSHQEIERSILQQMLYGTDANKLPLSRFRRIQSPGTLLLFKSLYYTVGVLAFSYIFNKREEVFGGTFLHPLEFYNWPNLLIAAVALSFLWVILHKIYLASFGVSLKSISLKNIEIKPLSEDQTSILNYHLDEIVYFFQSSNYDLVIIEDLDRFNNPEIFVRLREINSLVNKTPSIKRDIRFLYALRDDMFVNTERTKFFEFIVPVIPIINASNSIDMILKQGKRLALDGRVDRQFLREVSRYLNDLRLIQNIFNEYAIYAASLETDEEELLDANKLLATLIYKNVYPRDFELLHCGEGTLAQILARQQELIAEGERSCRNEIEELEMKLELAEQQTPSDLRELKQIYAMALLEKLPEKTHRVSHDQREWIEIRHIVRSDDFDKIIEATNLQTRNIQNHSNQINVQKLQSEIDANKTYRERRIEIEEKATDSKNRITLRVSELRSKIAKLRMTKLNELLRMNTHVVKDLFEKMGENSELARFLVLEGYLDDTYYQYTSLFHTGRLSPNDNKYLIQIRAFVEPEPEFPIDNPKEVIASMRSDDFSQSYVLNIKILDTLLSDDTRYCEQIEKLFNFLSSDFESCNGFLDSYLISGNKVGALLSGLADSWSGFISAIIASPNNITYLTRAILFLSENRLNQLASMYKELPEFVSANLSKILIESPELTPEKLICLNFEVKDFSSIKEHSEIARRMYEMGLFELTIANLEYIYQVILGNKDIQAIQTQNFTTIRSIKSEVLMKRVERDFESYVNNIILELPENSNEDLSSILHIISNDVLNEECIQTFLERQTAILPSLEDVPKRLYGIIFKLIKIKPTWSNCYDFMNSDEFDDEILIDFLEQEIVRSSILSHPMPIKSDLLQLRQFLLNAGALSNEAYKDYVSALPKPFKNFPEKLEPSKLAILIDETKITFTTQSLAQLADNVNLQVRFVATNISEYLSNASEFSLDDSFLEEVLSTEIDNDDKLQIIELMDLGELINHPERAALVGKIAHQLPDTIPRIDATTAQFVITHSSPAEIQISFLIKYHSLMTNDEMLGVLSSLPKPFSEIKIGYHIPILKNTPQNEELVKLLDSRNVISSWSRNTFFTNDLRVNLYRK